MATLPDQLKQLKQLDLSLLKQMLSDEKKVPREWVKELIQKFIHIVSTSTLTQRSNPMS
jgi:hypothetical protein